MTEVPHVYAAINAVTKALGEIGIAKDQKNQAQNFMFRGIDAVYQALSPLLAAHGLCVLPRVLDRQVTERQNKSGGALFSVILRVAFDFVAVADGSRHEVITDGEAMDSGDKATSKAMSAAYKYACFQAFCIPTEGDNDADATTHEVAPTKPPAKPAAPRQPATASTATKADDPYVRARAWTNTILKRQEAVRTEDDMHALAIDKQVVAGRAKLAKDFPELAAEITDADRAMFERVGALAITGEDRLGA